MRPAAWHRNLTDFVETTVYYIRIQGLDVGINRAQSPTTGFAEYACTGISNYAIQIINDARATRFPSLSGASTATIPFNHPYTSEHDAVYVEFTDGQGFVIDWHATLNPNYPRLRAKSDFEKINPLPP